MATTFEGSSGRRVPLTLELSTTGGIVHPSPAERSYLEQNRQQQQQRDWAWQAEAARINAMISAQIAGQIAESAQVVAEQGAQMRYEEQFLNIGNISIGVGPENRVDFAIPGNFGTALSFVATLTNAGAELGSPEFLWVAILTSVDGEHWLSASTPGTTGFHLARANGMITTRQHGPFGKHLALRIGNKITTSTDDHNWLPGKWLDLRLALGTQFI